MAVLLKFRLLPTSGPIQQSKLVAERARGGSDLSGWPTVYTPDGAAGSWASSQEAPPAGTRAIIHSYAYLHAYTHTHFNPCCTDTHKHHITQPYIHKAHVGGRRGFRPPPGTGQPPGASPSRGHYWHVAEGRGGRNLTSSRPSLGAWAICARLSVFRQMSAWQCVMANVT